MRKQQIAERQEKKFAKLAKQRKGDLEKISQATMDAYRLKTARICIGIDPGTDTGFAAWDRKERAFANLCTFKIHEAMRRINAINRLYEGEVVVILENPNTFVPFSGSAARNRAVIQGAGSIKRDFAIWIDYLADLKIPVIARPLQGSLKKLTPEAFKTHTGIGIRTSVHARDAAMMVFNL